MKTLSELDQLTQQTRRRDFEDGLVDFIYAVGFLALGTLSWFALSPTGMRWYISAVIRNKEITLLMFILILGLFILVLFGSRRLVDHLRQSVFWKERGFTKPLHQQVRWPTQLVAVIISLGIILGAFLLILRGRVDPVIALRSVAAAGGVATGITFLGIGLDLSIRRYQVVAVCGMVVSALILFYPFTFAASWLVFGAAWGLILALSGTWALRKTAHQKGEMNHE